MFVFISLGFFMLQLANAHVVFAQIDSVSTSSGATSVQATVPGVALTVSGIVAPSATVALLSPDGIIYRGAVADANGNFAFENILLPKSLSQFCIESIDVKRLGNSLACFPLATKEKEEVVDDIFLPPTLGLQRQEIIAGSDAVVFGYSMPEADVTIRLNREQSFSVRTDASGYYEYTIPDLSVGSYQMVAGAYYEAKPSAPSLRPALLQAVSLTQALEMNPSWFILPTIVLLFIVAAFVFRSRIRSLFEKKTKKLHHWWFVGY